MPLHIENEQLSVTLQPVNATLTVTDKISGRVYQQLEACGNELGREATSVGIRCAFCTPIYRGICTQ
ncbi:MAG: hypothetical protein O7G87_19460 [bacterium]|nr:hypothetical protein [bacterium]